MSRTADSDLAYPVKYATYDELRESENDNLIDILLSKIEKLQVQKYFSLKYTKGNYSNFVKKLKSKDIAIEKIEKDLKSLSEKPKTNKINLKKNYTTKSYSDSPISFEKMLRNNRK